MDFSEVIKNHYSCKKFDKRHVRAAQLNAILEVDRMTPTAKTLGATDLCCAIRNWSCQNRQGYPYRYGSPLSWWLLTQRMFLPIPAENEILVWKMPTHVMLIAANEGVDSCGINFFSPEDMVGELGLPESEEIL